MLDLSKSSFGRMSNINIVQGFTSFIKWYSSMLDILNLFSTTDGLVIPGKYKSVVIDTQCIIMQLINLSGGVKYHHLHISIS